MTSLYKTKTPFYDLIIVVVPKGLTHLYFLCQRSSNVLLVADGLHHLYMQKLAQYSPLYMLIEESSDMGN